ncbi:MAG: YggS family pyridoxal phosphate-dependent enzyme [Bacteroidia bacterium]
MFNKINFEEILNELATCGATLIAVSKTKPVTMIKEAYDCGLKAFGENYVQEMEEKYDQLPKDIEWHFIGHLQSNKVKNIAPFVSLIQSVDSMKLLKEINKEAKKNNRIIDCLLQIHIAEEETKFGLSFQEAEQLLSSDGLKELENISIIGLMGMATLSGDENKIRKEFKELKIFYNKMISSLEIRNSKFEILSMGMTSDYKIALEEGSNMVRIGSAIFGERN